MIPVISTAVTGLAGLALAASVATAGGPVLKTGQTASYRAGDDGFYEYGFPRHYTRDDLNDIVTDHITGLQWQDDVLGEFNDVAAAKAHCSGLMLDGPGWRLATIAELETLDWQLGHGIPQEIFEAFDRDRNDTLSGTPCSVFGNPGYWIMDFDEGYRDCGSFSKAIGLKVMCVRNSGERNALRARDAHVFFTGQTTQYLPDDDAAYQAGLKHEYSRNAQLGIVRDETSGIEWQDNITSTGSWASAVEYCQDLDLDGPGWRLPSVDELLGVVDRSRSLPAFDPAVFENVVDELYWSDITRVDDATRAWGVWGSNGSDGWERKTDVHAIRCVRTPVYLVGGASGSGAAANLNHDLRTNLSWQDEATPAMNWNQAIDYCNALELGGFDDWRLPNHNELISIMDFDRVNPVIDTIFKHIVEDWYWTSTRAVILHAERRWVLHFGDGRNSEFGTSSDAPSTRCVRGGIDAMYEPLESGGDLVVYHYESGLTWQDEPHTAAEAEAYAGDYEHGKVMTWAHALEYCGSLDYAGRTDWRLPNINELYTLTDKTRTFPAIEPDIAHVANESYWSATTYVADTSLPYAWIVSFDWGFDGWRRKDDVKYARCVSGGKGAAQELVFADGFE